MKKTTTAAFVPRNISVNGMFHPLSGLVLLLCLYCASSFGQEVPALEWAKSTGGPQGDFAGAIAVDASGNVYSAEEFYATADFDPGPAVFNLSTGGDHKEVSGDIEVFNAISPNADGRNDTFMLQYIDLFTYTQDNKVIIFNRWGDVISEIKNYNNKERVFKEFNNGRAARWDTWC
jgi:gliding motility-associated-like protein